MISPSTHSCPASPGNLISDLTVQFPGVETSERGRWNTNVHTGVQMDETELRRYFALMAEEAEEEQREWSEYVREMHRQCRKPLGRAWMRRHRETQDLNQHHPLGYCGNGNLLS
ncbi:hypothetical protein ACLB2K_019682 [Fragaria x ananassa]